MSKKQFFLLAALFSYLAVLLFYNLGSFPALHGDEAWAGLNALRIKDSGVYSPHGMNSYTASLYSWLIAKSFVVFGAGPLSMRLPGAFLNLSAALIMIVMLSARFGAISAVSFLCLLVSSAMFVFEGRLAWEVTALQNFFLAVIIAAAYRFIEYGRVLPAVFFLWVVYLGVVNHFIFISVPASLVIGMSIYILTCRDLRLLDFFLLSSSALLMSAGVYLIKPLVTDAAWAGHRGWFYFIFAAFPFVFLAGYLISRKSLSARIKKIIDSGFLNSTSARKKALIVLSAGVGIFAVFHATTFLGVFSNVILFKRLASWSPPIILTVLFYAWGGWIIWIFAGFFAGNFAKWEFSGFSDYERMLIFWLPSYMAVFTIFRNTNSIRYYIIPYFLTIVAMAVFAGRMKKLLNRYFLAQFFAVPVLFNIFFWRELGLRENRKPFEFIIGWHTETTAHFLKLDRLVKRMETEKLCRVDADFFIAVPLGFMASSRGWACDPARTYKVDYCLDCEKPPYFNEKVY